MSNRVALITGAARGIGRGIAEALSKASFDVAIADILPADQGRDALAACEKNGVRALYARGDISTPKGREGILKAVRDTFGRLDVLVNNAGVAPKVRSDLLEATEESFDRLITINLKGPYFLTQKVAQWMIDQKKEDGARTPAIINISSISAYTSSMARGDYCVSKAGVSMMTMLYADRLAEHGINVYEIRPGIIQTPMTAGVKDKYDKLIAEGLLPTKRWGFPDDIGRAAVALAQGAFPYSTGQVINVDGGFHLRRP
jgi:NAD(P)-dependent dehydrogenase (short-subunit alcohol dehydrogenase family)